MRPLFASILLVFLLASCAPVFPPATATPTLTPTRTPTPTPTLTPTATVTPTPSLPAEAAARLEGRDWRIENGQALVGDVVWYAQDAEGQWQPAPFVADFDKYQFSLDGLDIASENGAVRIFDPNATDEAGRVVYENGRFNLRFLPSMIVEHFYVQPGLSPMQEFGADGARRIALPGTPTNGTSEYLVDLFKRVFGENAFADKMGFTAFLIDWETNGWGLIENPKPIEGHVQHLIFETANGEVVKIPILFIDPKDIRYFWWR